MSESGRTAIVHLIHGTWPYGPFRNRPKETHLSSDTVPWFWAGSQFEKAVQRTCSIRLTFKRFTWSGRNSYEARSTAASELEAYLEEADAGHPGARHIFVAHSHGGTVLREALSSLKTGNEKSTARHAVEIDSSRERAVQTCSNTRLNVGAAIFLATPFAYLSDNLQDADDYWFNSSSMMMFCASIANPLVLIAMIAYLSNWGGSIADSPAWMGMIFMAVWIALEMLLVYTVGVVSLLGRQNHDTVTTVPRNVPIFIFRANRDEAALALGAGQALAALARRIVDIVEDTRRHFWFAGPLTLVLSLLTLPIVLLFIETPEFTATGVMVLVAIVIQNGTATAGLIYLSVYFALAASVGFWNVAAWPTTMIEIEPTPPGRPVTFEAIHLTDDYQNASLRHCLYDQRAVQRRVAEIIEQQI